MGTSQQEPASAEPEINFRRIAQLKQTFTPAAPVSEADFFRGRSDQLDTVISAITQPGQHVIVYGDRGVGKTSLVNVVEPILHRVAEKTAIRSIRVNCDATDTYSSVWRKVFREIPLVEERPVMGFGHQTKTTTTTIAKMLPENRVTPGDVQRILALLTKNYSPVVILDEFDRVRSAPTSAMIADTIKGLSDQRTNATLILVGVADSVDALVKEHASIDRSLVQVRMPRMSDDELAQIVTSGLEFAEMTAEAEVVHLAVGLSKGLPHYTHLIALNAGIVATKRGQTNITMQDVDAAVIQAVQGAQETIVRLHHKATSSAQKDNLYKHVLLACAIAQADSLGYFQPAAVASPLKMILGREINSATYSHHLADFCDESRGPVLERTGQRYRYRFRFVHPLMQPYVIMRGLKDGLITQQSFAKSDPTST